MQIGQTYSYVSQGYYNTWDELYGSTMHNAGDDQKLPGNYYIVDYNGDGVIDAQDNIPYGHSGWPQNTYNATFGIDWKGLTAFVQFYGVNNVTRQVVFNSLGTQNHVVYEEGSYWSKDNTNADVPMPRWISTSGRFLPGYPIYVRWFLPAAEECGDRIYFQQWVGKACRAGFVEDLPEW